MKSILKLSVAVASLAYSGAALAQEDPTESKRVRGAVEASTDEILVTARKRDRAEEIQAVPLAITAFNEARLAVRGFRNITDISYSMPNVALDTLGSAPTSAAFSVRGLGTTSSVQSLEPAVGTFVDGAYLAVPAGVITDTFDVGSIEVLRGPQGTLFGRNVTGGAVVINTNKPSKTFGVNMMARYSHGIGSDAPAQGMYTGGVAVTGPIGDNFAFRLTGYYNHDDGAYRNRAVDIDPTVAGGKKYRPQGDTWMVRPQLLWDAGNGASLLIRYEHLSHDGDMTPGQSFGNFKRDTFDYSNNYQGFSKTKSDSVTAELNWELGPGTLTNITNYRKMEDSFGTDLDATRFTLFHLAQFTGSKQVSNELRYAGTVGKLDFTVGTFAYSAELDQIEARLVGAAVQSGGGHQKTTSFAAFTENQFHITDKLTAIFGARFTHEKKRAEVTQISAAAKCGNVFPVDSMRTCIVDAASQKSWNLFGFKLGAQYEFSKSMMGYASFTRGFRSGGYNVRQVLPISPLPFNEEKVDAYEIGIKATYLDGVVRTNIAVFQNDVTDFQRTVAIPINVPPFTIQTTGNAADARLRGIEIDQTFKLSDRFLITGYLGFIDGKYTRLGADVNSDGVINAADFALRLTRVPRYTYGGQITYDIPVGDNMLSAVVSLDHRDQNFFTDDNKGVIEGANMLGARLSYAMTNGAIIALFGKNLLNEVVHGGVTSLGGLIDKSGAFPLYITASFNPTTPVGTLSNFSVRPRTIGVEASVKF